MPSKGFKALKRKQILIGQFILNKRASLVLNEITKLVRNDLNTRVKFVPIVTAIAATKRQIYATNDSLNYKSKQRRRDETLRAAVTIHGAANDLSTVLDGLVDAIFNQFKATEVVEKVFNSKKSVSNAIVKNVKQVSALITTSQIITYFVR